MSARILRPLVLVALAVLGLSACGSADDGSDDEQQQRLTVFAAASLTDSFTDLAEQFEEDHPGVDVQLSLAGSSSLAAAAAGLSSTAWKTKLYPPPPPRESL